MANYGIGSEIAFPFVNKASAPVDAMSVATSVSEVLSFDPTTRYLGLMVFIEDENAYYYFSKHELPDGSLSSGLEDSDFQQFSVSGQIEKVSIVDNYSLLTSKTTDSLAYVKNSYTDDATGETYESGLYLYTVIDDTWIIVSSKSKERYPQWQSNKDYYVGDTFSNNGLYYEVIKDFTSTTIFEDNIDDFVTLKEKYYYLTKEQKQYLEDNNMTDESAIYIINNIDESTVVETKKEVDNVYYYEVEITEGVTESILCTKTVQTVGLETITTIVANEDSVDGTTIKVGDTIEITKTINGITIYEYNILDNSVIENPFA